MIEPEEGASLNDCGCCEGIGVETPVVVSNEPGLPVISYRVGTHAQFYASMRAKLSVLPALRTRDSEDFSIALLDAWATVLDILTFYQERNLNEKYVRTATERRSILELSKLIGYQLRPGVAASTFLAFSLEESPGTPDQAAKPTTIEPGVKVQSIPGPGKQSQTFETIASATVRVEWNALKPRQTKPQQIGAGTIQLYLKGLTTQLQVGDALLILGSERETNTTSQRWALRILQSVSPDREHDCTVVAWKNPLGTTFATSAPAPVKVFALRQRSALFGHNAVSFKSIPEKLRNELTSLG